MLKGPLGCEMTEARIEDAKKYPHELLVSQAAANPKDVQKQMKMAKSVWTSSCGNDTGFESSKEQSFLALLKALDLHRGNIEVSTSAFGALCNMASRDEDRTKLKKHPKLMSVMTKSILAHSEHGDVLLHAFSAVSNLTLSISETEIKPIADSGMVQAILQALQERKHGPQILQAAMQSLSNMAMCQKLSSLINKHGGLEAIVSTLSQNPINHILQQHGCALLLRLAVSHPANKDAFRELNAIGSILHFLSTDRGDAHKAALAIHALYVVAQGNNSNKNVMRTLTAWNEVVNAMTLHKDNASVQKNACQALWVASVSNTANKDHVREIKGIEAIVNAMTRHRQDAAVQQYACGALASLAHIPVNQDVIRDHKGVIAIIVALKAHVNDPAVHKNGFAAIWTLAKRHVSNGNAIKSLKGIETIVAGMNSLVSHGDVQCVALGALSAVCTREGNALDEETELSVLHACVVAMSRFRSDIGLQKRACNILTALTAERNRNFLVSNGAVESLIVTKHRHKSVEILQAQCDDLLALLGPKTC